MQITIRNVPLATIKEGKWQAYWCCPLLIFISFNHVLTFWIYEQISHWRVLLLPWGPCYACKRCLGNDAAVTACRDLTSLSLSTLAADAAGSSQTGHEREAWPVQSAACPRSLPGIPLPSWPGTTSLLLHRSVGLFLFLSSPLSPSALQPYRADAARQPSSARQPPFFCLKSPNCFVHVMEAKCVAAI